MDKLLTMPHRLFIIKKFFLLKSPTFLWIFAGFTWFNFKYLPTQNFIVILIIAMTVDLITGIARAWKKGKPTLSIGLRDTLDKFIQYGGFIVVGVLLLNITVGVQDLSKYRIVIDAAYTFMILIELISICENLVEVSPDSKLVSYVIKPFMKLIKGRLPKDKPDKEDKK